jgi:hypothetical protein
MSGPVGRLRSVAIAAGPEASAAPLRAALGLPPRFYGRAAAIFCPRTPAGKPGCAGASPELAGGPPGQGAGGRPAVGRGERVQVR